MAFPFLMLFFPLALAAKVAQEPPTAADLGGAANAPVVCQTTTVKKEDFTTLRDFAASQSINVPDVPIPATAYLTLSAYTPAMGLLSLPVFAVDTLNPFGWATMLQMKGDGAGLKWTVNDAATNHKVSLRVLGDTVDQDGNQLANVNVCKLAK
ncbi:hypothetical protein CAP31_02595 [Sulfuriferula sp. AH1]|uniref:hypothetical protein n=1 Tax=Sulfuriferula sp. AH1 TaxID=1985873 RepID=UPI000B3B8D8C|nr:hypothetical protein [Sulfuriferula sp. AH1]ARU30670.1 hypothetical protein CAP31_02595 [Sulfuriferula sp. AH1]